MSGIGYLSETDCVVQVCATPTPAARPVDVKYDNLNCMKTCNMKMGRKKTPCCPSGPLLPSKLQNPLTAMVDACWDIIISMVTAMMILMFLMKMT